MPKKHYKNIINIFLKTLGTISRVYSQSHYFSKLHKNAFPTAGPNEESITTPAICLYMT